MAIQVDESKPKSGKLMAAGILAAVILVAFSMPPFIRALFVIIAVLAAVSGAWLFWG